MMEKKFQRACNKEGYVLKQYPADFSSVKNMGKQQLCGEDIGKAFFDVKLLETGDIIRGVSRDDFQTIDTTTNEREAAGGLLTPTASAFRF